MLGRDLSEDETGLFHKYLEILLKWQKTQRLVGSGDPEWIQRELFLGALLFARFVPASAVRLLDFGSGAGVPGIPLKIVRRELDVALLESRVKRVSFLRAAVRGLGLSGLCVVAERAERVEGLVGRFDVVTARCAGGVDAVTAQAARFLAPGGSLLVSGPPEPPPRSGIQWTSTTLPGIGTRHIGIHRASADRANDPSASH